MHELNDDASNNCLKRSCSCLLSFYLQELDLETLERQGKITHASIPRYLVAHKKIHEGSRRAQDGASSCGVW